MASPRQSVSASINMMPVAAMALVLLTHGACAASYHDPNVVAEVGQELLDLQDEIKAAAIGDNMTQESPFIDGDMLLPSADVARQLLNSLRSRAKRGIFDFVAHPTHKWPGIIIPYVLREGFTEEQIQLIRTALLDWDEHTCLKFMYHLSSDLALLNTPHLAFTSGTSCISFVGKGEVDTPQPIYLGNSCFARGSGPIAHQVGHALGLFHEHQRPDRDEFVEVNLTNAQTDERGNFMIVPETIQDSMGHPYDYASILHFPGLHYSINGLPTIATRDLLFQQTIGQQVELSFWDSLKVNNAYCQDACPLPIDCQNGGYQHPRHCNQCNCQDTYGGYRCAGVAPSVGEPCGGQVIAEPYPIYIRSPSYGDNGRYQVNQECAWSITAPEGRRIQMQFEGDFGVFCRRGVAYHWVEIRYKANKTLVGPRFCGTETPRTILKSENNEVRLAFKAKYDNENEYHDYDTSLDSERVGFQVKVQLAPSACSSAPCANGATCLDAGVGFYCRCAPGYNGPTCRVPSACSSNPCGNGATCLNAGDGFFCQCAPGYNGPTCRVPSGCASAPCANGATCLNAGDGFFCQCAPGYNGPTCQVPSACSSNPCGNGATCLNAGVGFYCQCAPGYNGPTCQECNCNWDSCRNGGTCIPTSTAFVCRCRDGFTGNQCQVSINNCGGCEIEPGTTWQHPCIDPTEMEVHFITRTGTVVETTTSVWGTNTTSTRSYAYTCTQLRPLRFCCSNAVMFFPTRGNSEPVCYPVGWGDWSDCTADCGGCGTQSRVKHMAFTYGRGTGRFSMAATIGTETRPCGFDKCTWSATGCQGSRCPCCAGFALDDTGNTCVQTGSVPSTQWPFVTVPYEP